MVAQEDSLFICDAPELARMNLRRPYKHAEPGTTIDRIRGILSELDCDVYETLWGNPYSGIYSVRLATELRNGTIGQNGKGRTKAYTLASAYAEFIERLQSGLINNFSRRFHEQVKAETGFYYYPDERILSQPEFDSLPADYLADIGASSHGTRKSSEYYERLRRNGYEGCIAVPFFDTLHHNVVYLPYNLTMGMVGSNGMAAGNTVAEGLFQGICELCERFAAVVIYNQRLTPPTVPRSFLANFPAEWRIIEEIEGSGNYEVIVKDFSCGQKFPVIGVIIRDRHKELYRLNAGADTCFSVALSRCLTEIHQGVANLERFEEHLLPIPHTDQKYFLNDDPASLAERRKEFLQFIIDGRGQFPRSLFEDRETYQFDPSVFVPRSSYEEEVRYLVHLLHQLGHNVYLRDVSFLGFPSFFVYIPTLSRMGRKASGSEESIDYKKHIAIDEAEDLFFPLQACTPQKMARLAEILETCRDDLMQSVLRLEVTDDTPWDAIPVSFMLTLFWYKVGRPQDALRNLKTFMAASKNEADEYYNAVRRWMELRVDGKSGSEAAKQLCVEGCNESLRKEIVAAFSDGDHLFDAIDIPDCPHCSTCALHRECLTAGRVDVIKRVNRLMQQRPVTQQHFANVVA